MRCSYDACPSVALEMSGRSLSNHDSMPASSIRVFWFNIFAISMILIVAEIAARVFLPRNAPFSERPSVAMSFETSGVVSFFAKSGQTIYAVEGGRPRQDRVRYRINEHGFRGEAVAVEKEPGTVRIAVVGGSHVFDQNSFDYEGNPGFPQLLEDGFRRRGARVAVINAGLPGADTRYHAARVFLDLRRFEPDIVILNSAWNDLKWMARTTPATRFIAAPPMAARNPLVEPMGLLDRGLGFSALYRHARDTYWREKYDVGAEGIIETPDYDAVDLDRGLDQYAANLVAFVQVVRGIGATPILALQERLVSRDNDGLAQERIGYGYINVGTHDELVALFEASDATMVSVAARWDVPLIDVATEMEGDLRFFQDHVHTTPAGSRRMAQEYMDRLGPMVDSLLNEAAGAGGTR